MIHSLIPPFFSIFFFSIKVIPTEWPTKVQYSKMCVAHKHNLRINWKFGNKIFYGLTFRPTDLCHKNNMLGLQNGPLSPSNSASGLMFCYDFVTKSIQSTLKEQSPIFFYFYLFLQTWDFGIRIEKADIFLITLWEVYTWKNVPLLKIWLVMVTKIKLIIARYLGKSCNIQCGSK